MKLLVIDGNSIINRAFYGIKLLTTKDGQFTNAIYGFMTTLIRILDECQPDGVAVAFDLKAPTFRHKAYAGYKAGRKGMPDELAAQLAPLKQLLKFLGCTVVECEGYEADDILGTLAEVCTKENQSCMIATGDRDSLQLVSPTVSVRIASTKMGKPEVVLYDEEKIKETYAVTPKQLIEVKALQGDTSDNIPGVAGIGPKGASQLIAQYGTIDYIYENLDTLDIKESVRKKLAAGKESAYLSRMLGTICVTAPIDTDLTHYLWHDRDEKAAVQLLTHLEMFSLIAKLHLNPNIAVDEPIQETEDTSSVQIFKDGSAETVLSVLQNKTCDIDVEIENQKIKFLCLYSDGRIYDFTTENEEFLRAFCADKNIRKRIHNVKPFYAFLEDKNIELNNLSCDTMLAAYLLNPSANDYSLERICQEYAVQPLHTDGKNDRYKAVLMLSPAADKLETLIEEKGHGSLLRDIEIPFARVLANMENVGFEVDRNGIAAYGKSLDGDIERLQQKIYEQVGYTFNIQSPKQLGTALFEKMGLPSGKKTKTGYSTNAEVLESLQYEFPVVRDVLEYRALTKLKSTYCDGLIKVIAADGRIHSRFNQTETRTGRISSTEPNLQNIPVRTERGRELRRFFNAKEGCVLVDADYSQIELRVLAHIANDTAMIEAFKNKEDIHATTAAQVFHLPLDMITPLMRSRAKAVNFGIVYGIGAFSLSKDIGVSRKEADCYIKDYLAHFSGVDAYMQSVVERAKTDGYVQTMFGRRRYLPELTASNFAMRSFGERVARNMPIQGTAADIIKIAMIHVEERLRKEQFTAKLILQVHDELIVEAPCAEAEAVAHILTEEMENAVSLKVPLVAEAVIGKTWYDAKG